MPTSASQVVGRLRSILSAQDADQQSDYDLLHRFVKSSDPKAFEVIVRRHGPMVLGVCRRLLRNNADADDAFQATFMVLVRRACSLSNPERLAGWLNRTAFMTARKLRSSRYRRQSREVPLGEPADRGAIADIVWRELTPIFDEELHRLPERLRLPIVLCFLEGRTKRATAAILGWPEGTISSRLQRGRELLRSRLTKRGIALSSGTFSLALFQATASAGMPMKLVFETVQFASQIAAGTLLSSPLTILTQGVLNSMFLTKIKFATVMALSIGLVGAGTGWMVQNNHSESIASAQDAPAKQPEKTPVPRPSPIRETEKSPTPEKTDREALLQEQLDAERQKSQELQRKIEKLVAEVDSIKRRATESELRQLELAEAKRQEQLARQLAERRPDLPSVERPNASQGSVPAKSSSQLREAAEREKREAMQTVEMAAAMLKRADAEKQLALAKFQQAEANLQRIVAADSSTQKPLTEPLAQVPNEVMLTIQLREADVRIAAAKRKVKAAQLARIKELEQKKMVDAGAVVDAEGAFEIADAELEKAQILLKIAKDEMKAHWNGRPGR